MVTSQQRIETIVKNAVKEAGLELIELRVFSAGSNRIRAVVDYPEGGVSLGECAAVNKKIALGLDQQGIVADDYVIEINSPGLDRALKNRQDFLRVKGRVVCLWFKDPVEDKNYLEAELRDLNSEKLFLLYKDKSLEVELSNIKIGKEKIK